MTRDRALVSGGMLVCLISASLAFVPIVARAQAAIGSPPFSPNIFVTPVLGEPFSAVVEVQLARPLASGGTFDRKSSSVIARDSGGRIHVEARQILPLTSKQKPILLVVHIYDPYTRLNVLMSPYTRVAREMTLTRTPANVPPNDWAQHGTNGTPVGPNVQFQDLGTRQLEGVDVHGYRREVTLPVNVSGTQQPVVVTDEYWYAPELCINLLEEHVDPRIGERIVRVTQLDRLEPSPDLFQVPLDYKVVDTTPPAQ